MMLKNNISFFTWLALLFFLSVSCTNSEQKKSQIAKKGVMDLRHFSGDLDIYLNGEWEFYWNQLLTPVEIRQQKPKPAFLNLPSYWNNQLINDKKISGNGYATFRLRILLDSTNQDNNGLEIKEILTSYKCWVNNNFLCENGVVSTTDQNAVPYFKPIIKTIDNKSDTIEIVIQVSNFSHKYGGFFLTPKLSSIERLYSEHNKELAYDLFLFGAIFIMALYHLGLYLINKKRISALYFSIFAFLISLRTILTGTEFLVSVIPDLTWNLTYRLEYLTLFISPYFYLAFLYHNFKDDFKRIFLKISLLICLSFAVLILFEAKIFTAVVDIYQLIILVFVFYGIFVLVKASGKKREGSYIIMISQFVLVIAVINDLLYNQGILTYMELTPLGLIIFILGQSLLLALKFNAAFVKNEELTAELNFRNENLEKMVRERTAEIYQQKEEIQTQAEKLISTNSILQEYLLELEKLSIVASKTDNAVIIMDGSGNFLWINSAFTRLYGYNIDDMVHVHKNILHSSSNPEIKNIIETCIQTKQSITYESNTPSASGEIIYTQTTITPILNENGEIEKLIAIDSDIRKLKKSRSSDSQ